ncbi:hypothetical protein L486_08319 [Kwoniella mangroviensis CBS 10435]|uniref:Uncharacterized protein n=1 Tax=Kwoniella mangroviensis CBS 10435 TaxID=1331196 RepID=A0A1B9IF03_9TREE|nr:hypothetical protein L486_08319 [Kwoniella mangroviensis CBS 10435]
MIPPCDIDIDFFNNIFHFVFRSCLSRTKYRPSSPDPEAQEGELETLLIGANEGWDDSYAVFSRTSRIVKERQAKGLKPTKPMKNPFTQGDLPPSYESHLNPPSSPGPSTYSRRSRPISGYSEFEHEIDEDARSLSINPTKLAEMARQFEPTLTLDDIRREEEEQAERERIPGHSSGEDGHEEEFGDFEEAARGKVEEVDKPSTLVENSQQ